MAKRGRPKTKQPSREKIRLNMSVDENYCRKCRKTRLISYFYDATDIVLDTNGIMSVCRDCCASVYDEYFSIYGNIEKALYLTCKKLNVRFSKMALEQTQSHIEKLIQSGKKAEAVFGYYKSKLTSLVGKVNENVSSMTFDDSDKIGDEEKQNKITVSQFENIESGIDVEYLKIKWGSELPISDLHWLEQKFDEWYDNYDIEGKAMQLLIEQLCFEELYVYKERQAGRDVSKRLKSIQDMMKSSKLSPRQETASDMAEFQTISEFIKKVEQHKPFVKENVEHKDVDKMEQQWKAIAGAIARTAGKQDENTHVFDEYFKDHTMDLSSLSDKGGV